MRQDWRPAIPQERAPRTAWIDAIRGLAILAIVVYHTLLWFYLSDPSLVWAPSLGVWSRFNATLGSVRVPLLLTVSGLVASRRVLTGLSDRTNASRAATNYYLYVVWLLIYAAFFMALPGVALPHRIGNWEQLLAQLLVPDTTLWYLVALAVYILVTAATTRWPKPVVFVLALVAYLASDLLLPTDVQATKVAQNWLFFLVGAYLAASRRLMAALTRYATVPVILASAVISALMIQVGGLLPGDAALHSAHSLLRSLTMVATAALATIWLTRFGPLRDGLSYLGSRTLAIYLLHPLLICMLIALATGYPALNVLRATAPGATLGPVLITAAIVAAGIGLRALCRLLRAEWLFTQPRWLRRAALADGGARPR